jgi:hypothetical protein
MRCCEKANVTTKVPINSDDPREWEGVMQNPTVIDCNPKKYVLIIRQEDDLPLCVGPFDSWYDADLHSRNLSVPRRLQSIVRLEEP